jgi:hypothetical protein
MGKPKPDNPETIKKAAILARRLVLNENRLATLQRCNAPEKIIAMEKERFLEFKERVEENPLATELLPQARKALAMENRRRHVFPNSDLPRESGGQNRGILRCEVARPMR